MTTEATQVEAVVDAPEASAAAPVLSYEEAAKHVWADAPEPVVDAAVEPSEEPSKAAPAEPQAPDPKAERVAARITAATRAEIRAAQARADLRAKEEAISKREQDLAAREAEYNLIDEDPVRFFEVKKKDPKVFLEKLAGEYKPEAIVDREVKALKEQLSALQQKLTQDQETAKQRAEREAGETAWREASHGFVAHIEASAERFPHLVAEYSEGEAVDAAFKALHEVVGHDQSGQPVTRNDAYFAKFGEYPDDDVIAEYLDAQAKQRAEARQNSAWRKRGESANGSQPLSNGDPNPKAPPVNKGSSPRTLTSRTASEKAAPPKQWTQEAADEESLRILARAFSRS